MALNFNSVSNTNLAFNGKSKDEKSKKVKGGTGAALAVGTVVGVGGQFVSEPIMRKMASIGKSFTDEEVKTVHSAIKDMVKESGLDKKGVRIKFLENNQVFDELLKKRTGKTFIEAQKMEPFSLRKLYDALYINMVRRGENAFFAPEGLKMPNMTAKEYFDLIKTPEGRNIIKQKTIAYVKPNSIILPKRDLSFAGFHEAGHAINWNLSKIGKFLQKHRLATALGPVIPVALGIYGAMTQKSKPADGETLTFGQKTKNFLRDNAGILSFAGCLPMLIEEGMASVRGQKYANKLLSKDLSKKVLKGNVTAYMSYLGVAAVMSLASYLAVKVKDNKIKEKEAERDAKLRRKEALAKAKAEAEDQKANEANSVKTEIQVSATEEAKPETAKNEYINKPKELIDIDKVLETEI